MRMTFWVLAAGLIVGAGCRNGAELATSPGGAGGQLQTLVDVTTGLDVTSGTTGTFNWAGQSFVVPGSGIFAAPRFNFYSFQKAPAAFGSLYLLEREYLGLPGGLGSTTPGFIARSAPGANGVYEFASDVRLTAGRRYWVYTDTQGSFAGSFDQDIYEAGDLYVSGFPTQPFRKAPASGRMVNGTYVPPPAGVYVDANFKLQAVRN